MSCTIFGQEAVGICVAFIGYCASIPPVSLRTPPPFTQGRLWCGGTPQVQRKTKGAMQNPSVAYSDSSPYRGAIQSSRRDTSTAPKGSDFTRPSGGFHLLTEQISPAHRADFTEGGMPPSYALQVNSVTGPQDFSSTSTSAGSEAPPLPSLFTMMVTVPVSPLPVPLWK